MFIHIWQENSTVSQYSTSILGYKWNQTKIIITLPNLNLNSTLFQTRLIVLNFLMNNISYLALFWLFTRNMIFCSQCNCETELSYWETVLDLKHTSNKFFWGSPSVLTRSFNLRNHNGTCMKWFPGRVERCWSQSKVNSLLFAVDFSIYQNKVYYND